MVPAILRKLSCFCDRVNVPPLSCDRTPVTPPLLLAGQAGGFCSLSPRSPKGLSCQKPSFCLGNVDGAAAATIENRHVHSGDDTHFFLKKLKNLQSYQFLAPKLKRKFFFFFLGCWTFFPNVIRCWFDTKYYYAQCDQ